MLNKVSALWGLFRKGQEVANPAAWKAGQVTGTIVAGLIIAAVNAAKAFDYEIPIDTEQANAIGVGIVAVVNVVLTLITSKRVGILPPVAASAYVPAPEPADAAPAKPLPAERAPDNRPGDFPPLSLP